MPTFKQQPQELTPRNRAEKPMASAPDGPNRDKTALNNRRRGTQRNKLHHIMIISDDVDLIETLQLELFQAGHQVSVMHDGLRGLLAANQLSPDLVVISWSPPRLTGLEICRRLRSNSCGGNIILLAPGEDADLRIAGLEAGANDCLSLPFVKEEFVARIHASLTHGHRRSEPDVVLRCADLALNRNTREVFRGDRFIRLTAKEFDLLEYLRTHYFQVLTRAQILENVWGYDFIGSSNIIEVYIRYLRKKLESQSGDRLIHTVRSVGYILRESA